MSPKDLAPAHIRAIAPYVPGKPIAETARELGIAESDILKLASNENPLGSSPKAIEALRGAIGDLAWYPDGSGHDLKAAISAKLAVGPENIVLGNGSNDVLELVARAFLTPADSAVYSRHAFMVYPLAVQAAGARPIEVPARNYGHDLDAMAAAIRPDTKIVFLANPNNPTGTFLEWDAVRTFVERVPPTTLVASTCRRNASRPAPDGFRGFPASSSRAPCPRPTASRGFASGSGSPTRRWRRS
jgi:histidinol-phosphate aminotransferase